MKDYIIINSSDTVAVALRDLEKGLVINDNGLNVTLKSDIPQGHKFALKDHEKGEPVIKYGHAVGAAKEPIRAGEWAHTFNVETQLSGNLEYEYRPRLKQSAFPGIQRRTFMGYRRENGSVGTRNEVWIIPTVGCVNALVNKLVSELRPLVPDGVHALVGFTHPYGCSQMGEDQENTRRIIADLAEHPNAGAVIIVGLGCENSPVEIIQKYMKDPADKRVRYLVCQDVKDEHEEAVRLIRECLEYASKFKRVECPVSELIVGMKCGGSDGLSGITANPSVGVFSDMLCGAGGTTILTEVPEFFGAEDSLLERCADLETFTKAAGMINGFKDYFRSNGQTIYENPSPGNKAGGISTLEDKALGNVQKSGSSAVEDVLGYGERVKKKGLNLLWGPGNDGVSVTAMAAAGAQTVLFTTGRGTPFGCPVPTIKIATNHRLAEFKPNWIDFNAGSAVDEDTIDELGQKLFDLVLDVAEGKLTCAEKLDYRDIAIFKQGVTL